MEWRDCKMAFCIIFRRVVTCRKNQSCFCLFTVSIFIILGILVIVAHFAIVILMAQLYIQLVFLLHSNLRCLGYITDLLLFSNYPIWIGKKLYSLLNFIITYHLTHSSFLYGWKIGMSSNLSEHSSHIWGW